MLSEAELQRAFQYAFTLCQNRQDAADLLQSAVEKYLIEIRRNHRVVENPLAFLRTLIRNHYIDQYRHRQRWHSESFEESAAYDISPVNLEQICINEQRLEQVWKTLSPADRDILYHWAVLGYSTDEACKELGLPRGTFLSRIHRLRKNLQDQEDAQAAGEKAR
jgi:RNA polymerase sigma factor (sigma-70 family)